MKAYAICLLMLLGCGPNRLVGVDDPLCNETCYTFGPVVQGTCKAGTWICEDGGRTCVGEVGPQPEVCDGLDNDCNGIVDNVPITGCSTECGVGYSSCMGGVPGCTAQQPLPATFCYDGPAGTDTLPGCHPGTLQCPGGGECCVLGQQTCQGEAVPHPTTQQWDVVVAVTQNATMQAPIGPYPSAIGDWCTNHGFRCALVATPDTQEDSLNPLDGGVFVLQDFTTGAGFQSALANMPFSPPSTGDVAVLGMPYEIVTPGDLNLSWVNTKKLVVLITDEEYQCALGAPCVSNITLGNSMDSAGANLLMFLDPTENAIYPTICSQMTNTCQIDAIQSDAVQIQTALEQATDAGFNCY